MREEDNLLMKVRLMGLDDDGEWVSIVESETEISPKDMYGALRMVSQASAMVPIYLGTALPVYLRPESFRAYKIEPCNA